MSCEKYLLTTVACFQCFTPVRTEFGYVQAMSQQQFVYRPSRVHLAACIPAPVGVLTQYTLLQVVIFSSLLVKCCGLLV